MTIGQKLRNRRLELNLTMLQVAKKTGVSEATVSRWESGDIANMKRDKIVALANALQVSPAFIMGWEDYPFQLKEEEECIIRMFRNLNKLGQDRLLEYSMELIEIPKYKLKKAENN